MKLYTSLVRLKQEMNGGRLPPMTPIPENAQKLIDPAFTIGLGALTEDEERGLRCPVRGCGGYYHQLGHHINRHHRGVGGTVAVKRALSIPQTARLVSQLKHEELSAKAVSRDAGRALRAQQICHAPLARRRSVLSTRSTVATMGTQNLRNRCDAQVSHRLIDLHNAIGRTPNTREAKQLLGKGVYERVIEVYGSWESALAQLGLEVVRSGPARTSKSAVLDALRAYYEANGQLPSAKQARRPTRAPLIHHRNTILRVLGGPTWYDCMRRAAIALGVRDGRYGLQPWAPDVESPANRSELAVAAT